MLRRVDAHRLAQRPRERLERGLDHVVRVRAGFDPQVQRQLRRVGERAEELLRQLVLEAARRARRQLRLEQREGTAGDVDRAARARLVHRHRRRAVAGDARAVAQRLVERLAEHDRRVLGGVVRARLQIARDRHVEIQPPVPREQVEHVVEKAHAGRARARAGAVETEREAHVGLAGLALDRGGAYLVAGRGHLCILPE